MPSKSQKYAQARRRRAVEKLQSAGLLGKVDLRKKPTKAEHNKVIKYRALIEGRAQAIQTDEKTARQLRRKYGLTGSRKTTVIPREKGERFRITKQAGEPVLKSRRKTYGQTITKTIGEKFGPSFKRPENAKTYYTIPARTRGAGGLKRHTFSSFDELLFYLQRYEVEFEDIEDRIEIEEFEEGSREDAAMRAQIFKEREAYRKRRKRKNRRKRK